MMTSQEIIERPWMGAQSKKAMDGLFTTSSD